MERFAILNIDAASGVIEVNGASVGATFDINAAPSLRYIPAFIVTGTGALAAPVSFTDSNPDNGWQAVFYYKASITTNTVTFFGTALSATQAQKNQTIVVIYENSVFTVFVLPSLGDTQFIETDDIQNGAVTNIKLADVATATFKGRTTAGTGSPEDLTVAQAKTLLNLAGTNTGDQTIALTGDVTGSGTGSFAATIANSAVTNAKMANMADQTIKGNVSGGGAAPSDLTSSQVRAFAALNYMLIGPFTISFESTEQSWNEAIYPWDGEFYGYTWSVISDIAGTDDATIDISVGASIGGAMSPIDTITIPSGTVQNTSNFSAATPGGTYPSNAPNNYFRAEGLKTTAGGRVQLCIVVALP